MQTPVKFNLVQYVQRALEYAVEVKNNGGKDIVKKQEPKQPILNSASKID